jgi:tetratricopeptide (TPR) repeat protein
MTVSGTVNPSDLELLELAEEADRARSGRAYDTYRSQLSGRADEFAAATQHFVDGANPDAALRLVAALSIFWQDEGRVDQGREVTELALRHADQDADARPRAMLAAGELAFRQGDQAAARRWSTDSLAAARLQGDRRTAGFAAVNLARVAFRDGNDSEIERFAREAEALAPTDRLVRRGALHMQAWAAHTAGDLPHATKLFEQSLAIRREMADPVAIAAELGNLGDLALERGDVEAAGRYLDEALTLARDTGSDYLVLAGLLSAAKLTARKGDLRAAVRLIAAARAGYERAGLVPDPGSEDGIGDLLTDGRAQLGDAFQSVWDDGASQSAMAVINRLVAR